TMRADFRAEVYDPLAVRRKRREFVHAEAFIRKRINAMGVAAIGPPHPDLFASLENQSFAVGRKTGIAARVDDAPRRSTQRRYRPYFLTAAEQDLIVFGRPAGPRRRYIAGCNLDRLTLREVLDPDLRHAIHRIDKYDHAAVR